MGARPPSDASEGRDNVAKLAVMRKGRRLHQNTRGNKGVKQKVPAETSAGRTLNETAHCEALGARVDSPVNRSSQLPSTTSGPPPGRERGDGGGDM